MSKQGTMNMLLVVRLLPVLLLMAGQIQGAAVFHTFEKPKLSLYKGEDTASITTWDQAYQFCRNKDKYLATHWEWCWDRGGELPDIYDGLKDDEQWVPVGWEKNNWLQIGAVTNGVYNLSNVCKHYSEIPEIPDLSKPSYCSKPSDCTGDKCVYECEHPQGYYPDPTDCQAYCYCSGGSEPSWWQTVATEGMIWYPYCADSDALDPKTSLLGTL